MTRVSLEERLLPEQAVLCVPRNGEDGEEERVIIQRRIPFLSQIL